MSDLSLLAMQASQHLSEAELHGVVCGIGVVGDGPFALDRLIDLVGTDALTDQGRVGEFVEAVLEALGAEDLSFALLLPDAEDVGVSERLEALAQWCASFLAGLGAGLGGDAVDADLDDDTQELMRDFAAIANLDTEVAPGNEHDDNQAERELLELEEFVKVGVLLLASLV